MTRSERSRSGSALIAVLWCLVILGFVATGMLHSTRLELRVAKNHGDAEQAYFLALAGVETAKALIYRDRIERERVGERYRSSLRDRPRDFRDVRLGRGLFRITRGAWNDDTPRRIAYGLGDEESRLNVNTASLAELAKLPYMTESIAASIVDWRDQDNRLTPQGAERDVYASLDDPYRIRDGAFETLRELLSVQGITRDLLLGEDADADGRLDPAEDDGSMSHPPDDRDGRLDAGWSAWLTVHSAVPNESAKGRARIDISTAGEGALSTLTGVSGDLAGAIVAYREQKSLDTIGHLLDVQPVKEEEERRRSQGTSQESRPGRGRPSPEGDDPGEGRPPPGGPENARAAGEALGTSVESFERSAEGGEEPSGDGELTGEKLVSPELLKQFADEVKAGGDLEVAGAVNVNTAPAEVLACLDGVDWELARSIVTHRRGRGPFPNVAYLLDVPGMTADTFKELSKRVTTRSATFRIQCEGVMPSTGARRVIEVVVRAGSYDFETLAYREYR